MLQIIFVYTDEVQVARFGTVGSNLAHPAMLCKLLNVHLQLLLTLYSVLMRSVELSCL